MGNWRGYASFLNFHFISFSCMGGSQHQEHWLPGFPITSSHLVLVVPPLSNGGDPRVRVWLFSPFSCPFSRLYQPPPKLLMSSSDDGSPNFYFQAWLMSWLLISYVYLDLTGISSLYRLPPSLQSKNLTLQPSIYTCVTINNKKPSFINNNYP